MRKSIIVAAIASALALAGCGSSGSDSSSASDVTADTEIGAPEKTSLTIALSAPNVDSQAPVRIAIDKGFYRDEGLDIDVIDADNIREGIVGGSLDLGVDNTIDIVDAAVAGTGLQIVAGYRQREPYLIAVSSDINEASDLAGKQIILGDAPGTPIIDVRLNELAKAGFDLSDVKYKAVFPPGFSNAWVENFVTDQVDLTTLFPRHRPLIDAAGGRLVLDEMKDWPNDSVAASEDWIAKNPNTLARFIRATSKGVELYKDLSQQDYVQGFMEKQDFTVTDEERDPEVYAYGPELYDADMGVDQGEFEDSMKAFGMELPEWSSYTDLVNLERAQKSLS